MRDGEPAAFCLIVKLIHLKRFHVSSFCHLGSIWFAFPLWISLLLPSCPWAPWPCACPSAWAQEYRDMLLHRNGTLGHSSEKMGWRNVRFIKERNTVKREVGKDGSGISIKTYSKL